MREGQPSLTAIWVCFARAVAAYEHELAAVCPDLIAAALLPRAITRTIQRPDGRPRRQRRLRLIRFGTFGMIDHLALRTHQIDQALQAALAKGIDQIVLLGAGLDARAYRINEARDAVVFEVDHPSTQRYKRKRAQELAPTAREVRYAACDFEQVTLQEALASVSFDPTRRSVWIWEGVTMYLQPASVTATLETIAQLTPAGSTLVATYLTPKVASVGPVAGKLGTGLLSAISEPVRCMFEPAALALAFSQRGLSVESDTRPLDHAAKLGVSHLSHALLVPDERIVVAKRIDV